MAHVIGSVSTKGGGSTKTTAAVLLALSYGRMGKRVLLLDYDKYHSAFDWADNASEKWPESVDVQFIDSAEDLQAYVLGYASEYDVIIVDSGPADDQATRDVIELVDQAVAPIEPQILPMRQLPDLRDIVDSVQEAQQRVIDLRVLLVRVSLSSKNAQKSEGQLQGAGFKVCKNKIPQRNALANEARSVPVDRSLYGYLDVARELEIPHEEYAVKGVAAATAGREFTR